MTDPTALQDRVALVAGGGRGVGRAVTERLVAAGARVAVVSRDQPDDLPAGARWFGADVREPDDVDAVVDLVADHYGRLDVAVGNAGGSPRADAATASPTFSTAILTLNLLAPLHLAVAANRVMQGQAEGGAIVALTSVRGIQPAPGAAAYGAAKAGLLHLTQSLAAEWGPKVRVNAVSMGGTGSEDEDLTVEAALDRPGTAADVADAVAFLASPASAYVSGANLVVDGGGDPPAFLGAVAGP